MSYKTNENKKLALGIPYGTARNKLNKLILFSMIQKLNLDICYQCNNQILSADEMSAEHKIPWLNSENPIEMFFDLNNIAFSHLSCNCSASRRNTIPCENRTHGKRGCNCSYCKELNSNYNREYKLSLPKEIRQERRRRQYQRDKLKCQKNQIVG